MVHRRYALFLALAAAAAPIQKSLAQGVLLAIKPRVGDTLVVRLSQKVEMSASPANCGSPSRDSRSGAQPCVSLRQQMTTVSEVFSRAIVQSVAGGKATVLAVTDSVRTAASRGTVAGTPRRVRGREGSMRLRVSADGGAEVIDEEASEELRSIFGQMPAMLSKNPVKVGGKWTREMRIPISGEAGAMGRVRATFQLDSLGRNGDIAYISMRGTLAHDHRDGSTSEVDGWMTGSLELDRRLSWITETRAEIDVTSMYHPSAGSEPMRVRTRVTQVLKAGLAQ
ncbi:MAG TPA: DUF6263 family protein [Gemmatimonadaceae bacterium]